MSVKSSEIRFVRMVFSSIFCSAIGSLEHVSEGKGPREHTIVAKAMVAL